MSGELNLSFRRNSNNNNKSNSNEELARIAVGAPPVVEGSSPELRAQMSSADLHKNAISRGISPGLRKLRTLSESLSELPLQKFIGNALPKVDEGEKVDKIPEDYGDLEEEVFQDFPDRNDNDDLADALFESRDLDALVRYDPHIFDILIDALDPIQEDDEEEGEEGEEEGEEEGDAVSVIVDRIEEVKSQLSQIDADRQSRNGGSNRLSGKTSGSAKTTVSAIEKLAKEINKAVEDAKASGEYKETEDGEEAAAEEAAAVEAAAEEAAPEIGKRKRVEKKKWEPEFIRTAIRRVRKKARTIPQSQGALSNVSNLSSFTATKAFLSAMRGSRVEDWDPTDQAKFIFGSNWTSINGDTLCGYCRFPLKDRQPQAHYNDPRRRLRYSLEHKTASNYQCSVLKIPLRLQKYSPLERLIMSRMSEVTCFHCNYIKLQRRFITCPLVAKVRDWRNLKPNVKEINTFLLDVYGTEYVGVNGKNADGQTSIMRLVDSLNPPKGKSKLQFWKEKCAAYLTESYLDVCNTIKQYVDYKNAYERVKLIRSVIRATRKNLIGKGLESKEIKKLVSKAALAALKECDIQPWSANVNDLDRATAEKGELPLPQFPWTPFTFSESVAKKRTRSKKYKNRKSRKNLRK